MQKPTIIRKTARSLYDLLALAAMVSAPVAAVYAHLAWQEAVDSGRDFSDLKRLSEQALAQRQDDLEIQRAILQAWGKLLPETERTRLGIERLVGHIERQFAAGAQALRERRQQNEKDAGRASQPPKPPKRDRDDDAPGSAKSPNQFAEEFWKQRVSQ